MTALDLRPALPALIVALTALVVLLAQAFAPKGKHGPYVPFALLGLGAALVATLLIGSSAERGRGGNLGGALVADELALFLEVLVLGVGVLAVLLASSYLRATGSERGEHYALLLFSLVGMLGLVSVTELISLFVALEIMSVSLYALAGSRRDQAESQEAAIKYFVTGAFSSAFLLYGIAMLYGVSGSTSLGRIGSAVASASGATAGLALLGTGLLLVGFGFKIASVPFHMWTPDVYEGAPTTVTAFMAAGVKVAAFGALLRVFGTALAGLGDDWRPAIAILAALSMLLGNLGALAQSNVKRMLAYSSVAHAGYLLAALTAAPRVSAEAILFYLVGYAAVNLGTFGALSALARSGREPLALDHLSGLSARRPALAAALTLFLISLTGVPVSAGFVGKFYLFSAAVGAGYTPLAIIGVLMSVVSAYYYLRVVVHMYMKEAPAEDAWAPIAGTSALALALSVVVVLGLGIWPAGVLALAKTAARSLL
jgi:NADH-quinone oxidoreductase subunit N